MRLTKHVNSRMNQRAIGKSMVDLVLNQGRVEQDKYVLDRREVDRRLDELNHERGLLLKIRDKGGVTVVADGDTLITAYNKN